MLKINVFIAIQILFFSFCFGQDEAVYDLPPSQTTTVEGTFQLMTTNEKANEVFTSAIYSIVENSREINNMVVVKIGEYTWLRILSMNTINDPNFVPLPSGIVVIDSNDPSIINSASNNSNK